MGSLVNLKDLSVEEIIEILDIAEEFMAGKRVDLSDKLVANLFLSQVPGPVIPLKQRKAVWAVRSFPLPRKPPVC